MQNLLPSVLTAWKKTLKQGGQKNSMYCRFPMYFPKSLMYLMNVYHTVACAYGLAVCLSDSRQDSAMCPPVVAAGDPLLP